jgi:hypothetical protein
MRCPSVYNNVASILSTHYEKQYKQQYSIIEIEKEYFIFNTIRVMDDEEDECTFDDPEVMEQYLREKAAKGRATSGYSTKCEKIEYAGRFSKNYRAVSNYLISYGEFSKINKSKLPTIHGMLRGQSAFYIEQLEKRVSALELELEQKS